MHGRCKPLTVLYFPNSEKTPILGSFLCLWWWHGLLFFFTEKEAIFLFYPDITNGILVASSNWNRFPKIF